MTTAFDGICVVDLSDRLSGAFAARLFGDFGADVILAERPGGHPLRSEPPFLDNRPGIERSVAHAYANWNKRSIVLDDRDTLDAPDRGGGRHHHDTRHASGNAVGRTRWRSFPPMRYIFPSRRTVSKVP